MMNIEQFFNEASRHDWFYDYSDDHRVWTAGNEYKNNLYRLAEGNTVKEKIITEFRQWTLGKRERPTLSEFIAGD
jgi:hypothetical protein